VIEYARVFFVRYAEIKDGDKMVRRIEANEQRRRREHGSTEALRRKLALYENPEMAMVIRYGNSRHEPKFTEENDRFLLARTLDVGYGNWDRLKAACMRHLPFAFDYYLRSRSPQEIGRRVEALMKLVEREMGTLDPDADADEDGVATGDAGAARGKKTGKRKKSLGEGEATAAGGQSQKSLGKRKLSSPAADVAAAAATSGGMRPSPSSAEAPGSTPKKPPRKRAHNDSGATSAACASTPAAAGALSAAAPASMGPPSGSTVAPASAGPASACDDAASALAALGGGGAFPDPLPSVEPTRMDT